MTIVILKVSKRGVNDLINKNEVPEKRPIVEQCPECKSKEVFHNYEFDFFGCSDCGWTDKDPLSCGLEPEIKIDKRTMKTNRKCPECGYAFEKGDKVRITDGKIFHNDCVTMPAVVRSDGLLMWLDKTGETSDVWYVKIDS